MAIRCLKFAPLAHIMLMWSRNRLKVQNVLEKGTWVYMVLTAEMKTVYIGETGGKENPRTVL